MKRNLFWKFVLVVLVVAWSLYSAYPPNSRDVVEVFAERGVRQDDAFSNIVFQARELQKINPERAFANLRDAVGSTPITNYFPFFDTSAELYPTTHILNRLQRESAGKIKRGLDLQGGTSFLVEMDISRLSDTNDLTGALSQAVEVLRKRVDRFGVAEPVIQPAGNNRILIQLPGLTESDRESARRTIQRAAFLEFRLVHEQSDDLVQAGEIPPGHVLLQRKERSRTGVERLEQVIVKRSAERGLTGNIISSAMVVRGNLGEPQIDFTLNAEGAATFGAVTRENVGRRLAIVLDGELATAPVIQSPIETGRGQITGNYDLREAFEIANTLENPLRAPLEIAFESSVDPTLGKDSVRSGVRASIMAVIIVSVFMLIYYLFAGVVANVALTLNIIIIMGVMSAIGATFTLPGIAAIVLTIGMAVDANVLIYERIREELAKGKSLRGGIAAGYDRAFTTIFDSNITTLISAVVLIYMGTGPVKGFGVTLAIGIVASMFTALVVTRLIFDWMLDRSYLKRLRMLRLIGETKIDFMRWAAPAFVASWMLIVVGVGYGVFGRGVDVLGVEFSGGTMITMNFDQTKDIAVADIRKAAESTGVGAVLVSYQRDLGSGSRSLMVTVRATDDIGGAEAANKVVAEIQKDFPEAGFTVVGSDQVGPSVGAELRNTAILAALIAMFGMLVYVAFRYEFSFAIGAVVAIIHDVLMTTGWYFLAGRELNATTVAALLTIIGFSINDTIVIFDRIREDLKLGVPGSFREVMNRALNETLSRTIITSVTTFLATLALYVFGGGPINDFAFTFLVGIITGVYSTIYIAGAIVLWWHKGERPAIGTGALTVEEATPRPQPAKA